MSGWKRISYYFNTASLASKQTGAHQSKFIYMCILMWGNRLEARHSLEKIDKREGNK